MTEPLEPLQLGEVMLYDGIAIIARGDLLTVFYPGDAAWQRSRWMFMAAERLIAHCPLGVIGLIVVPPDSKSPGQATRAEETAAYARFGPNLRRVVVVSESGGFQGGIVRLVVSAYVRFTRRADVFFFVKDLAEGLRRVHEVRSGLTPDAGEVSADLSRLRTAFEPR
jgi:hypothetical protein